MYKKIKFYAYRDNKGATGGPGGVLYLQRSILGNNYQGIKLKYYFRNTNKKFRKIFKDFYWGAFFQTIYKEKLSFNNYYICNDIATACALSLLRKKYSLIYHQQGPIIEELTNFGIKFKFGQQSFLRWVEKQAFTHAHSVHFPANGAEDMFFSSPYRTCERKNVHIGMVLPNTIEIKQYPSTPLEKTDKLTFLCVGSMTLAKGQDQTLAFMNELLKRFNKSIRLIMVGNGPLKKRIILEGENLAKKYQNFEFIFKEKVSHEEVMQLHELSDIYVMLHRISIFDLATLEAMSKSSAIILSNVGGNIDFNVDDNILLVDCQNYKGAVKELMNQDINQLKIKNKQVFDNYFSKESFAKYYKALLDEIINQKSKNEFFQLKNIFYKKVKNNGIIKRNFLFGLMKVKKTQNRKGIYFCGMKVYSKKKKKKNTRETLDLTRTLFFPFEQYFENLQIQNLALATHGYLRQYKNIYKDKKVVIAGCGATINFYEDVGKDTIYMGANRVFLCDNINFDYLFAQDQFPEGMEEFNNYKGNNCKKFYGILSQSHCHKFEHCIRIPRKDIEKANASLYYLESIIQHNWPYDISVEPFGEFKSTIFSVLMFALYTGTKKIYLVGCDCDQSGYFYGNDNRHKYDYLILSWNSAKQHIKEIYPDIEIISLNPVGLKGLFKDVYTQSYIETHPELKNENIEILNAQKDT